MNTEMMGLSVLTEEFTFAAGKETLAATRICSISGRQPHVITFHGTGPTASHAGTRYILDYLARNGLSSLCFDFSGHGKSTGDMQQATLSVRKQEGHAAAAFLDPQASPVIIGTSMGGYIAALLAPVLNPQSLILFCPAAYPDEAMELKFGENFAAIAKRPGAYLHSPAFHALKSYRGKLLIIAAGKDELIPKEVPGLYAESAPLAGTKKLLWMDDSDHKIHTWLTLHPPERQSVLSEVLAAAS